MVLVVLAAVRRPTRRKRKRWSRCFVEVRC
jgi:hypothetical protein